VNSPAELSDEALVRLCQETLPQDTRAFEFLVVRHQEHVYAVAYRMMGNAQEAEDLTQDVFINVYRSLKRFRGDAAISTWIYRITVNACLDALGRQRGRGHLVDVDLADSEEIVQPVQERQAPITPEESAVHVELVDCIRSTMMSLQDKERLVLTLRDVEGMEYQKIADILDLGMSAVKMRIHRARLAFRQVFASLCRDFLSLT
jgi:RNA polymerase sigma-70 factor (ECF subfamily)